MGVWLVVSMVSPSRADAPAPAPAGGELEEITVTGRRLTLRDQSDRFDAARQQSLLPSLGASAYGLDQQAIEALPQGKDTPLEKVLLQAPGVSSDSAVSNPDFHVRNEYANVQYRINGIALPDGVSALGSALETGFIGGLTLLDGVLPAQYGLRTAGVVDIRTKAQFDPGGTLDLYAGSLNTLSPSFEYGGSQDRSQYFVTGRYLQSSEGLENPAPTVDPLHDRTVQGKLFGYASTILSDTARVTGISGAWVGRFQIPDQPGLTALGDGSPAFIDSGRLDEHETDRFYFGMLALQTRSGDVDTQLSAFTRYAAVDFIPDVTGDLAFNGVAAQVSRRSSLSGFQFDAADRLGTVHTLRAGVAVSAESTRVDDVSTLLPAGPAAAALARPIDVNDDAAKLGYNAGVYVQDAWALAPHLELNVGTRFDQLQQFVSAHQWSPRLTLLYTPSDTIHVHGGIARYFTPPMQVQAEPANLGLYRNTVEQPAVPLDDPVRPERATYVDVGIERDGTRGLTAGLDLYVKRASDLLDDGQFGQAVVLEQFNYARGFSKGAELKLAYQRGGWHAYANLAYEITKAEGVSSNQYLFTDPAELAYAATHFIYTDDAQTVSASAGVAYRARDFLLSVDGFYGSGLRSGFANLEHVPGYAQWNLALLHDVAAWSRGTRPLSFRASVINLLDRRYLLRSGDGIGEFAPQYGPRRGFFVELTQRF